jgi:hypothetical protein
MHRYEIKDGKDALIYRDDELVEWAKNWDTTEGAEEWAAAMVAKLDAQVND